MSLKNSQDFVLPSEPEENIRNNLEDSQHIKMKKRISFWDVTLTGPYLLPREMRTFINVSLIPKTHGCTDSIWDKGPLSPEPANQRKLCLLDRSNGLPHSIKSQGRNGRLLSFGKAITAHVSLTGEKKKWQETQETESVGKPVTIKNQILRADYWDRAVRGGRQPL